MKERAKELFKIIKDAQAELEVIRKELLEIREMFTDKRRTEIIETQQPPPPLQVSNNQ